MYDSASSANAVVVLAVTVGGRRAAAETIGTWRPQPRVNVARKTISVGHAQTSARGQAQENTRRERLYSVRLY